MNKPLPRTAADPGRIPYQKPQPHDMRTDMVTLFQVNGSLMYVDPQGVPTGYDDVFTRIDRARAHYAAVGLGERYVEQFIRQP